MKLLALCVLAGVSSSAALVHHGVVPCPLEVASRLVSDEDCCAGSVCGTSGLTGDYIEVRDCTVFGGACHVNSELESQGRSALIAWRLDRGGVVVAAVESDDNLAREGPRRAVFYVAGASAELVARLARSARLESIEQRGAEVSFERDGDRFHVVVPGVLEVAGEALADRSCCSMPSLVWYAPLATGDSVRVVDAVVGNPDRCSFEGDAGLTAWTYEGANTAFVGRFTDGLDGRTVIPSGHIAAVDRR